MHSFGCLPKLPGQIKGEKSDVEGYGVCGSQHWHSGGRVTDHTGEA